MVWGKSETYKTHLHSQSTEKVRTSRLGGMITLDTIYIQPIVPIRLDIALNYSIRFGYEDPFRFIHQTLKVYALLQARVHMALR